MAQLTIQTAANFAVTPTANVAAAGGDYVVPSASGVNSVVLRVTNGGASSVSVVLDDPTSTQPVGATTWNPDVTTAVPAAATRYIPIKDVTRFVDPLTGRINWTYSATPTSVTVEVVGL